mmetsp:Transcript_22893/g.38325  ORF Transcript_22893/g.38325 Transcript_22893/m.38325 type:complete len:432 (-) Transcript_22893:192-1487(-)
MGCANSKATQSATDKSKSDSSRTSSAPMSGLQHQQASSPVSSSGEFHEKYKVGVILGQGSFSVVREGRRNIDDEKVAVKIVTRNKLQREDELSLRIEVEVLMSLDHPHIVRALDFFEEREYFYLVLEHIDGGELFDRLIDKAFYSEGEARDLFIVLLNAIKYCHDRNVIHRDIKPENILLTSKADDIDIKLADFGFAVKSGEPAAKEQAGTPGYIAPEIIQNKPHGKPVDMWSLGVVLYMLLGGYPPFFGPGDDTLTIYRRILRCEYEFHPENWESVSSEGKSLIQQLLNLDPEKRLTVEQALTHPWLQKSREELAVIRLDKNLALMKKFRNTRASAAAAVTGMAIEVVQKLSSSNIAKNLNVNDVAIDVMRKLSGASLTNDAVIQAARKRSGANLASMSSRNSSSSDLSSLNNIDAARKRSATRIIPPPR